MNHIEIHFGATCKPLKDQIKERGFTADADSVAHWQRCADAMARLSIHQLIARREIHNGRQRLLKQIAKGCSPIPA